MMRRLSFLGVCVVLGVAGLVGGCAGGDSSDGTSSWLCRADGDCKEGFVCDQGECVNASGGSGGVEGARPDAGPGGSSSALAAVCKEGDEGCTCGWSEAENLGKRRDDYGLIGDEAGGVLVVWEEQTGPELWPFIPLNVRRLDPGTEVWSPTELIFSDVAGFKLAHDAAGHVLVLGGYEVSLSSAFQPGVSWVRHDAATRTWSEAAEIDPEASLFRSHVLSSAGATYLLSWPPGEIGSTAGTLRSLAGASWEPVGGSGPPFPAVFTTDASANVLATWTGPPEAPGQFARWFDAGSRSWGDIEQLSSATSVPWESGLYTSAVFDAGGNATVYWEGMTSASGAWVRTRSAETGAWSDETPVPTGKLIADARGELHLVEPCGSDSDGCPLTVHQYDPDAGTWNGLVLMENAREVRVLLDGKEAMLTWRESVGSNQSWTEPLWSSRLGADGQWTEPAQMRTFEQGVSISPPDAVDPSGGGAFAALGEGGGTIVAWNEPYDPPRRILTSRYDAASGWLASELVFELPPDSTATVTEPRPIMDSHGQVTMLWSTSGVLDDAALTAPFDLWVARRTCRTSTAP